MNKKIIIKLLKNQKKYMKIIKINKSGFHV